MIYGWRKMQGTYKINNNGKTYVAKNVITNAGKVSILNAVAGKASGFASSMVAGIGTATATENDTALNYAVGGNDINAVITDSVNQNIYFKATLPSADTYEIYELGTFSINYTGAQNNFGAGSINLLVFGAGPDWTDVIGTSTIATTNNRIGTGSVQYSALGAAKGYVALEQDFSLLPSNTTFDLAYYTDGVSSLAVRFKMDDANYFEATDWTITNGYHIVKLPLSSFVATGTPSLANIQQLEIEAAGTSATLSLDALRYTVPVVSEAISSNLLSRVVLDVPQVKLPGVSMDIEYMLELNI